ncbi:alkaline phytoceramidase [Phlegmacium glaucopus]|nr:alkaline phytoceramidase [Phlegmacium glaucopus]
MDLSTVAPWLQNKGVYGPVTATLDWCEINFQFSPYIAEIANTFSNLFMVGLALCGALQATKENLPTRFLLGYAGLALVGVGSFLFHATLLFEAQLADELPMIYVGSMSLFLLFDNEPGFGLHSTRSKLILVLIALFNVLFTWSYMVYRNPVYHQIVFASIIFSVTGRVTYILKISEASHRIPAEAKKTIAHFFSIGAVLFAVGFLIWNVDNIFCHTLTKWKVSIGWPVAFLLEGHSWWHILTGAGVYYKYIGIHCTTLCTKDDPKNYTVVYRYGLPHVTRLHVKTS